MPEDLFTLHEEYTKLLNDDEYNEYILDCQDFLKHSDVEGWKRRYQARPAVPEPVAKKRRMQPDSLTWVPNTPCLECGSPEVIDDIPQGQVVCTNCGLVQSLHIYTKSAESFADSTQNRGCAKVIHRYSRIVYFRSLLQGMSGMTSPTITEKEVDLLRSTTTVPVTPDSIQRALKQTGMLRLRRHKVRLAEIVSDGAFQATTFEHTHYIQLLKTFRLVEYHYDNTIKSQFGKRKVFFSYNYLFYQLCFHLGCMQYTGTHHLLKGKQLLATQHRVYGIISKKTELKCDLTVQYTK